MCSFIKDTITAPFVLANIMQQVLLVLLVVVAVAQHDCLLCSSFFEVSPLVEGVLLGEDRVVLNYFYYSYVSKIPGEYDGFFQEMQGYLATNVFSFWTIATACSSNTGCSATSSAKARTASTSPRTNGRATHVSFTFRCPVFSCASSTGRA